jgi:hypothetical protein
VEQAGQALASAVFWSFAQMVNPGPPDPYTRQWYADLCANSAALILAFKARTDRETLVVLFDSLRTFWPGMTAAPIDTLLMAASADRVASVLFPSNATEQDIGSAKSAFTTRAEPLIQAFYEAHPDLEIEMPAEEE